MYEDEIPVGRAENLTNKRFGRWTVLYRVKDEGNSSCWKCRCDCGTERVVRKQHLKSGRSQSCGCLHKEIVTNYHLLDITGQRFGNLFNFYQCSFSNSPVHISKDAQKIIVGIKCIGNIAHAGKIAGNMNGRLIIGCLMLDGRRTLLPSHSDTNKRRTARVVNDRPLAAFFG